MRIGIDFRMAGTENGGIGRYVFELARHILEIDRENQYILFCRQGPRPFPTVPGRIQIVESNARHYSLAEQTSFLRILNKANCDLVHFPNFNLPLLYKRPFVVTIHDLIHHKMGGVKKTNLLHFAAYKKIISSAVMKSRAVITVSEASKSDILDQFATPPEKIHVIYEGLSIKTAATPRQITQIKQVLCINKPYFLFVGVMQRNKNLPGLCRGFKLFLRQYRQNFDLVIAGRGDPHYPEIKKQCLEILDSKNLIFASGLTDEQLAAVYAGAYAFVSASLFEGFGLPGLEAMNFGLPLAVSNIPAFNEIYENGAIFFEPQNAQSIAQCLNLLAQDRLYYMQLKNKALQRSKNFSWDDCAKLTLDVYKQCASLL